MNAIVRLDRSGDQVGVKCDVVAERPTRHADIDRQPNIRRGLRPTRSLTREPAMAPPRVAT